MYSSPRSPSTKNKVIFVCSLICVKVNEGEHSLCLARPNTKSSAFHVFLLGIYREGQDGNCLAVWYAIHSRPYVAYSSLQNCWVSQRACLCLGMSFDNMSDQNNDVIAQRKRISKSLFLKTSKLALSRPAGVKISLISPATQFYTVVKHNKVHSVKWIKLLRVTE